MPVKFTELRVGSELHENFRLYLEKRYVLDQLDVYRMIERVESGMSWAPNEVAIACHGLCNTYLGLGEDPELIPVDEIVIEHIRERLSHPTITMFKELKSSVAQTLEEHYTNFVSAGGQASDLKKVQTPTKNKGSPSPRKNPSKLNAGSPFKKPSATNLSVSTPAPGSTSKSKK